MADSIPMWWMRGNPQQYQQPEKPPPASRPEQEAPLQKASAAFSERFRRTDPETMLLLALLWLLWQEHANRKLLLALAYIIW